MIKKLIVLFLLISIVSCTQDEIGGEIDHHFVITLSNPRLIAADGLLPRWSPSNNYIAYSKSLGGNTEIWLRDLVADTAGCRISGFSGDQSLTWNPTGTSLAFEAFIGEWNHQIWTCDLNTGDAVKLTNYNAQLFHPDWLKNGTHILVNSHERFYLVDINNGTLEQIGDESLRGKHQAGNWNSTQFSFTSEVSGNDDIYIVNLDGSGRRQITVHTGYDDRARWSPDGTKLLFESDRSGENNIWMYDLNCECFAQVTTQGGRAPDWSPDGSSIVYYNNGNIYTAQFLEEE